jgi:hypothetical protein
MNEKHKNMKWLAFGLKVQKLIQPDGIASGKITIIKMRPARAV